MFVAPNADYEVRILAVNAEGFGEFSNSITFSTSEDGEMFAAINLVLLMFLVLVVLYRIQPEHLVYKYFVSYHNHA